MSLRYRRMMSSYRGITSPLDIANCSLWFDFSDASTLFTDAGSTPVASNDDLIYQANDKSGNGFNVIQATSGERPLYKTNYQNGLSAAYFNVDRLARATMTIGNLVSSNAGSVIAVIKPTYPYADDYVQILQLSAPNDTNEFYAGNWTTKAFFVFGNRASDKVEPDRLPEAWQIVSGIKLGSSLRFLANGDEKASATNSATINEAGVGTMNMGDAWECVWYCAELIVYKTGLSDADRRRVETYLNRKWNIY